MLCAAAAWLLSEPVALRVLAAAAAAAAVTGAFLTRSWDRAAGRQVADLTRGRASDAWQTEERIAELESELEESRELRAKLDAKLRAKRVELAGLRGEHAALLRRYATAETERASVLEDRRQLTGDTGAPKAPGPARAAAALGPAVYLRAARALEELTRTAEAQRSARATATAGVKAAGEREKASAGEAEESPGKPGAGVDTGSEQHARPATALPARRPAAAIAPYGPRRGPGAARPEGNFDFFGTQALAPGEPGSELRAAPERHARAIEAAQQEDLADVVGEEALAERRADTARPAAAVIDLTAHDETEKLDLGELRNAVNS
ncbi:hypothetical protein GCM10010232_61750 [Streptomyces amakusaensis]